MRSKREGFNQIKVVPLHEENETAEIPPHTDTGGKAVEGCGKRVASCREGKHSHQALNQWALHLLFKPPGPSRLIQRVSGPIGPRPLPQSKAKTIRQDLPGSQ